jgi:hypothetical protein
MRFLSLFLLFSLPAAAWADGSPIPLDENGFVESVKNSDKARIFNQLGEPARQIEVSDKDGEPVGAIWHYHYLNTSGTGEYYKTTELDFIGNQVVTVVFSMDDFEADGVIAPISSEKGCESAC